MSHMKNQAIDQHNTALNITDNYLFKLRDSLGIVNVIIDQNRAADLTIRELTVFVENEIERRFPSGDIR